jgi:hypothetical protein
VGNIFCIINHPTVLKNRESSIDIVISETPALINGFRLVLLLTVAWLLKERLIGKKKAGNQWQIDGDKELKLR